MDAVKAVIENAPDSRPRADLSQAVVLPAAVGAVVAIILLVIAPPFVCKADRVTMGWDRLAAWTLLAAAVAAAGPLLSRAFRGSDA